MLSGSTRTIRHGYHIDAVMEPYAHRDRCPACGTKSPVTHPTVRSNPPAEELQLSALGAFLSGYSSRRVFFTYHRCRICGALYCPLFLSQDQLDILYQRQQENMAEVPLPARVATQRGYLEILRRYPVRDGDYLELGPDIGLFAKACAEAAPFGQFHLFEPNLEVHPVLVESLRGHNARVTAAPYSPDRIASGSLAVAVAIHVLDHLLDPVSTLEGLRGNMQAGGLLFLVTHDESSLLARALGRRWPPFTLQHPQLFSPQSLGRLLRRCGFEVVACQKTRNFFPLSHFASAALSIVGLRRVSTARIPSPVIGLRLGNIATVARKG